MYSIFTFSQNQLETKNNKKKGLNQCFYVCLIQIEVTNVVV